MSFAQKMKVVFSKMWDFLAPFVMIFLSGAGKALAASAMKAVAQVAADLSIISSDEKRQAAFKAITQELAAQGIELGTSVINAAIEAAVAKLKAKT
jgi:hypothetical protein